MEADRLVDLVDRYVQAWNEPDTEQRRLALATLYSLDGSVTTQSDTHEGIEAIAGHIADVYNQFIGSGRFRFRSGGALSHHGCILFRWEMVDNNSGALADAGMNLFLLEVDGQIRGDYQFVLGVESSIGHLAVAR